MNRYPLWKYLLVVVLVGGALLYALPNYYGDIPAIQISAARNAKIDAPLVERVENILRQAGVAHDRPLLEGTSAKFRVADTDTQIRARDLVASVLGDEYIVALNLMPATPEWLRALGADPMSLGLDLRGGVYFLMQVDMRAVLKKAEDGATGDIGRLLREEKIREARVARTESGAIETVFRDAASRDNALVLLRKNLQELVFDTSERGAEYVLTARLAPEVLTQKKGFAIEQNILSLKKRVDGLGVSEPVIQRQGDDRIVVQLPGVQDSTIAKKIIGRTATLDIMLVDDDNQVAVAAGAAPPAGSRLFRMRDGSPILLKNRVIYSGDNIVNAYFRPHQETGLPTVAIGLDARGGAINQKVSGENVGKRMAVVYVEIRSETRLDASGRPMRDENGRELRTSKRIEEVITAPRIREQIGQNYIIDGLESIQEANELALLLRSGAFAAPVDIIEERTIGPSLGVENIARGFRAVLWGFIAIGVFMILYYQVFGVTSVLALSANLVLLVAAMSIFPTTLTLPGMAGIALTLGMAIDANVLINERIREELRNGNTPQASIHAGYDRAWGTILDSNITTLIAGVSLFAFGSGPVRGFAVVLCLGILTSMFSSVVVSRALVNLYYGQRAKLARLAIGNTSWHRPSAPGQGA